MQAYTSAYSPFSNHNPFLENHPITNEQSANEYEKHKDKTSKNSNHGEFVSSSMTKSHSQKANIDAREYFSLGSTIIANHHYSQIDPLDNNPLNFHEVQNPLGKKLDFGNNSRKKGENCSMNPTYEDQFNSNAKFSTNSFLNSKTGFNEAQPLSREVDQLLVNEIRVTAGFPQTQEKSPDIFLQDLSITEQSLDDSNLKPMLHNPFGLNISHHTMNQSYNRSNFDASRSRLDNSANRGPFVELGQKQRVSEREYFDLSQNNSVPRNHLKMQGVTLDPHALSAITDDTKDLSHLSMNNLKNFGQKDNSYLNLSNNLSNMNETHRSKKNEQEIIKPIGAQSLTPRSETLGGGVPSTMQNNQGFSPFEYDRTPEFRQTGGGYEQNFKSTLRVQAVDLLSYVNSGIDTKSPTLVRDLEKFNKQTPNQKVQSEEAKKFDFFCDSSIQTNQFNSATKSIPKTSTQIMRSTNKEIENLLEDLNYLELSRISSIEDNFLDDDEVTQRQSKAFPAKNYLPVDTPLKSVNQDFNIENHEVVQEEKKLNPEIFRDKDKKKEFEKIESLSKSSNQENYNLQDVIREIKLGVFSVDNVFPSSVNQNQESKTLVEKPNSQNTSSKVFDRLPPSETGFPSHLQPINKDSQENNLPSSNRTLEQRYATEFSTSSSLCLPQRQSKGGFEITLLPVENTESKSLIPSPSEFPLNTFVPNNQYSQKLNANTISTQETFNKEFQFPVVNSDQVIKNAFRESKHPLRINTPSTMSMNYETQPQNDPHWQPNNQTDYFNPFLVITPQSSLKFGFQENESAQLQSINSVTDPKNYTSVGINHSKAIEDSMIANKMKDLYKDIKGMNAELSVYINEASQSPTKSFQERHSLARTSSPSSQKGNYGDNTIEQSPYKDNPRKTTQGFFENKVFFSSNASTPNMEHRYSYGQDLVSMNSIPSEAGAYNMKESDRDEMRQNALNDFVQESVQFDDSFPRPLKKFSNPLFKRPQLADSPNTSQSSQTKRFESPFSTRNYHNDSLKLIHRIFDQPKTTKSKPIFTLLPPLGKDLHLVNLHNQEDAVRAKNKIQKNMKKELRMSARREIVIQEEDEFAQKNDIDRGLAQRGLGEQGHDWKNTSYFFDEETNLTIRDELMNVKIPISYYNPARDLFKHTIFGFNVKKEKFIQGIDERKITIDNMEIICINCQEFIKAREVDLHSRTCDRIDVRETMNFDMNIRDKNVVVINSKLLAIKEKILSKFQALQHKELASKIGEILLILNDIIDHNNNIDELGFNIEEAEDRLEELSNSGLLSRDLILLVYVNRSLVLAKEKYDEIQLTNFADPELIDLKTKITSYEKETVKQKAELEIWKHQAKIMTQIQLQDDKNLRYVKSELKKDHHEVLSQIQSDIEDSDRESSYGGTSVTSGVLSNNFEIITGKTPSENAQAESSKVKFYSMAVNVKLMLPSDHPGKDVLISDLYEACLTQKVVESEWEIFIKKKIGYQK